MRGGQNKCLKLGSVNGAEIIVYFSLWIGVPDQFVSVEVYFPIPRSQQDLIAIVAIFPVQTAMALDDLNWRWIFTVPNDHRQPGIDPKIERF